MLILARYSKTLRRYYYVRGVSTTNGRAQRSTRIEWTEQVSIPLSDIINKDTSEIAGDVITTRRDDTRHSECQARKAREKQRKAWMGKEISPMMDNGWDFEGKWRGEDLPTDILPNAGLPKVLLMKKASGVKRWIPITNLPPGDLVEIAVDSKHITYKTDKAFWDAICRRAEYISHCFSVKQMRMLLDALATSQCTAHPGLLRKLSSELLERFPQLTLLTCADCADAYQRLGFNHTGTYIMLALSFVQEMENIRYPLVGSEKPVKISSLREVEMTVKMIVAFSKAELNGSTPNDLIDCCAFTLSSNRNIIEECLNEYIAAVNAFRRLSRHVTGVEIARMILASGTILEIKQIAMLARAVHGLEGSKDILQELAGLVEKRVTECRAVKGDEAVEVMVKYENEREEELDDFGMPITEVHIRKISINIDHLIDLVESFQGAELEVPDSLTRIICSTIDDFRRAIRVLHWSCSSCLDHDRFTRLILVEKKKLMPHGLREVFENPFLTSRQDFLAEMEGMINEESDRLREDQCAIIARAYAGFPGRFDETVNACLKQLSVRLSQKRASSSQCITPPGERSEYSGSLVWKESMIDREEIASQICELFESYKMHPKLLDHFSKLVPRMSPDQFLRCCRAMPKVVVDEAKRRENDNSYLYGDDNPEEIEKILKVPEGVMKEILSLADEV